jgi:hypothetical protein
MKKLRIAVDTSVISEVKEDSPNKCETIILPNVHKNQYPRYSEDFILKIKHHSKIFQ